MSERSSATGTSCRSTSPRVNIAISCCLRCKDAARRYPGSATFNVNWMHRNLAVLIAVLIAALLAAPAIAASQPPGGERLFYVTSSPDAIASLEKNARSVSIIGPQSYRVDSAGNLTGQVPAAIL